LKIAGGHIVIFSVIVARLETNNHAQQIHRLTSTTLSEKQQQQQQQLHFAPC